MTEQTVEPGSAAAVENARPLNATQTRNLQKILEGDFAKLRSMIRQHSMEKQATAEQELRAASSSTDRDKFRQKYEKVLTKHREELEKLRVEAGGHGWNITGNAGSIQVNDTSLAERIQASQKQIKLEEQIAMEMLAQQHTDSERVVLLASITGQAENVLTSIPTAEQLMIAASQEREDRREKQKELNALRAKGGFQ